MPWRQAVVTAILHEVNWKLVVGFVDTGKRGLELLKELSKTLVVTEEWEAGVCTQAFSLLREFCGYTELAESAITVP